MSTDSLRNKIKIREYQDSDFETCRSLWAELVEYHQCIYEADSLGGDDPGQGFERYMANPLRRGTWVAEINGKVVGLVGLLVESEEHSEVEPIVVSGPYRGQGIGGVLMRRVVAEAEKSGTRFLSIRPGVRNKNGLAAFTRLGFNRVWTVQLIRELKPTSIKKWLPGLKIHDNELSY